MERVESKAWQRSSKLKEPQFLTTEHMALRGLGTEPSSQVLKSFLAVHTYAMKDGYMRELFFDFFRKRNLPVLLLNGAVDAQKQSREGADTV